MHSSAWVHEVDGLYDSVGGTICKCSSNFHAIVLLPPEVIGLLSNFVWFVPTSMSSLVYYYEFSSLLLSFLVKSKCARCQAGSKVLSPVCVSDICVVMQKTWDFKNNLFHWRNEFGQDATGYKRRGRVSAQFMHALVWVSCTACDRCRYLYWPSWQSVHKAGPKLEWYRIWTVKFSKKQRRNFLNCNSGQSIPLIWVGQ